MITKFRAWDRLTGKMFPVGIIDCSIQLVYIEELNGMYCERYFDEVKLMQSTWLKDKNGKEIFEGDIVKYKIGWNTFTEEVAYDKNFAGFGVMDAYVDSIFSFGKLAEGLDLNSLEVVGNIYENKELLGGK